MVSREFTTSGRWFLGDSSLTEVVPREILRAEGHFWWNLEDRWWFLVEF